MRAIGELKNKSDAKVFSHYLSHLKIENQVTEEPNDIYEIWVYSEDDVPRAIQILNEFMENPEDEKYKNVFFNPQRLIEDLKKEHNDAIYLDARTTILARDFVPPRGPLTLFLVFVCVAVGFFSKLGESTDVLRPLFIVDILREGNMIRWLPGLQEIRNGEIWRIFSPMFIHFGFLHLFFNMWWLLDLGSMVEDRKGSVFFVIFILVVSGISNFTQFTVTTSPMFGGMSGVLYGLIGYIWMKGKFDPASRLFLHPSTVMFMIIWYFLCLFGVIGNVANGAHTGGLVVGILWGYFSSPHFRRLFK